MSTLGLRNGSSSRLLAVVIVLTTVLAAVSLFIGISEVSIAKIIGGGDKEQAIRVLLVSRIPRTAAILLAGSALAIAGLVMQIIVRNRFVEPSTAGTVESASLGFLVVTIFAPGWPLMAKMGISALFALAGTALFLRILRFVPLRDTMLVPLVGIMLGGVIGAVTMFFAYRFNLLPSVLAWTIGDFSGVIRGRYELLWFGFAATVMAYIAADRFTVAGMGRDFTINLGLDYKLIMTLGLVLVSVIASVTLISVGSIPFLGLIVPNIVSLMVGDNMRITVPLVASFGAFFVLICDILGRIVRYPYEIPIGVVVGIFGSAIFLALILRKRHGGRA
ncbi:iron chelate uptake ABC transporter family permease subunit [Aureimonas fodinaquatilis]|uniref:Iron chelate uptake ABC transporter family permease subunit n=1 Tax=Aureimonas fodinaquatilis TaxID=2565783 RepID=A0A5B0DTK1_9HYPH|nr:iron chelate uptake ABC transporter family permease subunit [Aureimonas fodinaquatilis]KAA0969776.1 iron chelate uptake ABC transporter family permease subunit [Aureimonas fodinaquatilis]